MKNLLNTGAFQSLYKIRHNSFPPNPHTSSYSLPTTSSETISEIIFTAIFVQIPSRILPFA